MRALILSFFFAIPAFAEPIKYELVPDPESISFTYSFDERDFTGYFPTYTADIALDWDRAANSSLDVEIQTGDASAGFIFASQTLRGPGWVNQLMGMGIKRVCRKIGGQNAAVTVDDIGAKGLNRRSGGGQNRLLRLGSG